MTGKRPKSNAPQLGYAYVVFNPRTGLYKLGSARKPNVRVAQLSREMRSECRLLHTVATNAALRLEREVQERFLHAHQGGEWFDLTTADLEALQSVSTVFYRDAEWMPESRRRSEFDSGSRWARSLPICGQTEGAA